MAKNRRQIEICKWLLEAGLTQTEIARKALVAPTTINLFIKGFLVSKRLYETFLSLGCSKEILEIKPE